MKALNARSEREHEYAVIAQDSLARGIEVSTVYLGVQHPLSKQGLGYATRLDWQGHPQGSGIQRHYAARKAALAGHAQTVEALRARLGTLLASLDSLPL